MALFNVTNRRVDTTFTLEQPFMASNANIQVSTIQLTISELLITEQEWLGNL